MRGSILLADGQSMFNPASPGAESIRNLGILVLAITGLIFLIVEGVLLHSVLRFRRSAATGKEPPQVYGTFNISGTFYVSDATLKVAGNGGQSNIGSQYVSLDLAITGNGNVGIVYKGPKVAPVRILTLVE